jgi:hypothetical protein
MDSPRRDGISNFKYCWLIAEQNVNLLDLEHHHTEPRLPIQQVAVMADAGDARLEPLRYFAGVVVQERFRRRGYPAPF